MKTLYQGIYMWLFFPILKKDKKIMYTHLSFLMLCIIKNAILSMKCNVQTRKKGILEKKKKKLNSMELKTLNRFVFCIFFLPSYYHMIYDYYSI